MFGSNDHYGHRAILARLGVADTTPISGIPQHGWSYDFGTFREDALRPSFFHWYRRGLERCRRAELGAQVAALNQLLSHWTELPAPA